MMPIFDALPTIDVLIYFAASSGLSQPESLSKAMRLWSIVQKLYSEDFRIEPSDQFNPAQWRSIYHPTGLPTHSIAQALDIAGVDTGHWSREWVSISTGSGRAISGAGDGPFLCERSDLAK